MHISRVVVSGDGQGGGVSEELQPVEQQLQGDDVAEPGGLARPRPCLTRHHSQPCKKKDIETSLREILKFAAYQIQFKCLVDVVVPTYY